jgi:ABC-type multidrug transport system ATPase subunit
MLTADIIPTSGTATLNGLDILTHQNDVRRLLGYCPQFDALLPLLSAREHLTLFARIKGVPEELIADYCEHLILRLGLQEGIADKPTRGYSGGNKRKLCVGIALIGNPPIVFLDEPSVSGDGICSGRCLLRSEAVVHCCSCGLFSFSCVLFRPAWIRAVVVSCGI